MLRPTPCPICRIAPVWFECPTDEPKTYGFVCEDFMDIRGPTLHGATERWNFAVEKYLKERKMALERKRTE